MSENIENPRQLPKLFGLTSTGSTKVWEIRVVEPDTGGYKLKTTRGLLDGKQTVTYSSEIKSKNIGRKNETTALEQALLEASSKWCKKLDEGYLESAAFNQNTGSASTMLPMLAHSYSKRSHNISWPAATQPKLNGVRCLATKVSETQIQYMSRGGKPFNTLGHLTQDLLKLMEVGETFDGEIFKKGLPLQDIVAAIKRERSDHELLSTLEYHVYDVVHPSLSFWNRFYNRGFTQSTHIYKVNTVTVNNEEELLIVHRSNQDNGYEGTMIRNIGSSYIVGHRSVNLQKLKDFQEEEFLIVGGNEASGEDEGTVVFTCATKEGRTFDVRPEGTREYRAKLFSELDSLVGKHLTVRFQDLTNNRIPTFPVGVIIRDYE
jgi:DNA ligase-1